MPRILNRQIRRRSEMSMIRDRGKLKSLVVTLYPTGMLGLKPERARKEELVSLVSCYSLAVKQRVAKERAEKLAKKKETKRYK